MHPALRKSCSSRSLLRQTGKTVTQLTRIYADKADGIKLPPEPTTCCMSGCANCVWIEYAETLYKMLDSNSDKAREIILQKITDPNLRMFLSIELKNLQYQRNTKKEQDQNQSATKKQED